MPTRRLHKNRGTCFALGEAGEGCLHNPWHMTRGMSKSIIKKCEMTAVNLSNRLIY